MSIREKVGEVGGVFVWLVVVVVWLGAFVCFFSI